MKRAWLGAGLLLAVFTLLASHAIVLPGLVGLINDDGYYALAGRTLAAGQGFVDWATPGHPANARYPIGFPALVALFLAGAGNLEAELARLAWIGPLGAAVYVLVGTLYLGRAWPRAPWAAVAGGALLACHPVVLYNGTLVMSDLFTGAVVLLALMTLEPATAARPRGASWRPLLGGLLCGLTVTMRYAALPLAIAATLVLLRQRRWPELRDLLVGLAASLGTWLVLRAQLGGETYVGEFFTGVTPNQILDSLRLLSTTVIPGLMAPWVFRADNLLTLALGLATMAGLAWVCWRWWFSPAEDESPLVPLYLGGSLALMVIWQLAYSELGDSLMTRLALPLAPLLLVTAWRGLAALPIPTRALGAGLLLVGLAGNAWQGWIVWHWRHGVVAAVGAENPHRELYEVVRTRVPEEAVLIGWNGAMNTFYTDRPSYHVADLWRPEVLHDVLRRYDVDYILVTPQLEDVQSARVALRRDQPLARNDLTARVLGGYARAYPRSVKEVWRNKRGDFALWQVIR